MPDFELDKIDLENAAEPEVVKAVLKDIKAIGDNNQEAFTKLNEAYEEIKKLIDEREKNLDPLLKERMTKFSEEIVTRQQALDKSLTKRIDDIEVAMQRPWMQSDSSQESEEFKMARDFYISSASIQNDKDGVDWKKFKNSESVNLPQYRKYREAFNYYLRSDPRTMLTPEMTKDLIVGVDPQGGYTCPAQMSARITKRLFESDPIRALADVMTISKASYEELVDWGDAGAEWEGETDTNLDDTTPEWKKLSCTPHIISTRPKASQTFLEDSVINVENWLADKVANRFLRTEGTSFVTGDGVGKPRGFLTYANGTNYGQVEQINMGAAATLTADGFYKVKYGLIEWYMNRGTWVMNRTTVRDAVQLKDGVGRYLWQPGFATNEPATIAGLPYRMSTTMPAVAANALSVALADWREAYLICDRTGISVLRNPYRNPPFVEYYTRKRVGGVGKNFQAIKIGKIAV